MSKFLKALILSTAAVSLLAASASASKLGLGTEATPEQIAGWDIDIRPDGQGLPDGRGTVLQGEEVFAEQCAACHGDFAEGVDRWPVLAGGVDTLATDDPVKTVGSYWPYLSTVYDYIYRAMPFGNAQSLTPDQTYAIVAYLLYMNDVGVDEEFELSRENFTSVRLPNEHGFIDDDRPDTRLVSEAQPCMTDCKSDVTITKRARIIDVTPEADEKITGINVD